MAVVTVNDIVAQMRAALALSEPDLDTTIGSPVRKILDAVGEVVAEAYVDRYLIEYQYDIDAKTGTDLDEFVRLFGFARYPAQRATGTVIFERNSPATEPITIPVATQLATEGAPPVVVQTTVPALLLTGDTSIAVPVQAVEGGTQGNVAANGLRRVVNPVQGITSFTNVTSMSGGQDAESDAQLRSRFKATIFRSMAGTEQMFLATALNDPAVSQANVIGAAKRRRETIEIVGGTATSTVQDARYVYPDAEAFGVSIDAGSILTPGVHYTFTASAPPIIDVLDAGVVPDGVYELEFEYVPLSSRNDPLNGVTNRVDVYVNGSRATEATEVAVFRAAKLFNDTADDPLNRANFERTDASQPVAGNYFVALSFAPVMDPSTDDAITINGVTYVEGEDYFLVNDVSREGGTPNSLSGIEFVSTANGATKAIPADGANFQVEYIFNAVPRDVEAEVRTWKLITTDVRVHQAKSILLNLHLALIYEPGYTEAMLRPEIESELGNYIANVGFNGVVQVSDLLEAVNRVAGVDAVRFLTSSDDATEYAIQRVSSDGTTILETYASEVPGQVRRAIDIVVADDEYPVLNMVELVAKAGNTFGPV